MSIHDVTHDNVLLLVSAVVDDVFKLAHVLGVVPTSQTLRSTMADLVEGKLLVEVKPQTNPCTYRRVAA